MTSFFSEDLMIRFRNFLPLAAAVLIGAATLGAPTQAHAAFTLTLHETGFSDVTITDNGVGDASLATGVISFSGSFGDFNVQVTTGSSNSTSGTQPAQLTINSLSITGASSSSLRLTLTDTGFTAPSSGLAGVRNQLSSTQIPQGTTVTYQSTVAGTATPQLSLNGVGGVVGFASVNIGATPYTITSVTNLTLGAAGTVQMTGITQVAVPAPAGVVLALTAVPFLGLGSWLRRRKQA